MKFGFGFYEFHEKVLEVSTYNRLGLIGGFTASGWSVTAVFVRKKPDSNDFSKWRSYSLVYRAS